MEDQPQNVTRSHFPCLFSVQQVHRNKHCDDDFCHENTCYMTTDLETQSSFPKGNIINTSNSAIPEADKNKQLYWSTIISHIPSSILVTWEKPALPPRRM